MSVPIRQWTDGVPVEEAALQQIANVASLPIVWPHVAIMPDVHFGYGATVGTVVPTLRAIIPAAVGVDIGCGMCAVRTTLAASQLPDNLHPLYVDICEAVPHGGAKRDEGVGAWAIMPEHAETSWQSIRDKYNRITSKHPIASKSAARQLGTLGGGNHFIELCLDEEQRAWVMLHSGSRGAGNRIGTYFTEKARERALKLDRHLPDRDLGWLDDGTEEFDDYIGAVGWAQDYARRNREIMLSTVLRVMRAALPPFSIDDAAVNCHHNYVEREEHFGEAVWLTRKGAVSARLGELGIIPGSMGTKSYIVRGKGNADSFHSCSHGAGRVMSRARAKKEITLDQHQADTVGVVCGKDARMLDESPRAYKSIDAVMAAQRDLVDVVHTLKQVLCVKG
jgi:tRNA-splicing ligase RtcB (3'-phosphate/5'-hydroxy nucleic acid ligase)